MNPISIRPYRPSDAEATADIFLRAIREVAARDYTADQIEAWARIDDRAGIGQRNYILSRVPKPLQVEAIEYRLEKTWGVGFLPGDNETGFIVFRLTEDSADWARKQGGELINLLGKSEGAWRETPVDDRSDEKATSLWHRDGDDPGEVLGEPPKKRPPTISEYLDRYGFSIPIEKARAQQADQSIQSRGSFYSYGKAGRLTVIDPARGKVYFAYAG